MITFLLIGSLVLGIFALILPLKSIFTKTKNLTMLSFSLCSISLLFQFIYLSDLIKKEAINDLLDTGGTSLLLSSILLITIIILNIVSNKIYDFK